MSNIFELHAEKRDTFGTRAGRRLRRDNNQVPAIIYGAGKSPEAIKINHDQAIVALGEEAFYSHIITINVDGKSEQAVLKAVQRHPYKNKIKHLDFMRVKANQKITMHVPLHFIGADDTPGVKQEGGVMTHHQADVEVRCLPKDLPEAIELDVSKLALGDNLHLSDLKLSAGVELVNLSEENNPVLVSVHTPKVEAEPEPEAVEATEESAEQEGEGEKADEQQPADDAEKQDGDSAEK
ncbi:MAG: 50S ribosomal protein L25/general stress protein Ctc [Pseudomonadota bacterium]